MISVIIVEDNKTIREGLAALINGTEGFACIASYGDCESFLNNMDCSRVDVVLMDIGLPGMSGIEGVIKAKKICPDLNILILTVYEESKLIFEALCAGACGYLVKKTPPLRLLDAIKDAYEGGSPMSSQIARKVVTVFQQHSNPIFPDSQFELTSREKEVLTGLAEGSSYLDIAQSLFISIDTVRHHIRNIYRKLHVHSQSEAVAKALRKGLI